jgi:hypothetical protein
MRQVIKARGWGVLLLYGCLFAVSVFPVALGLRGSQAGFDEMRCYLPAITQMRSKFPAVDLREDSFSASPPGYTHLLAGLSLVTGDSLPAHRAWHATLCLAGAIFLMLWVAHLSNAGVAAVAAMLPMVGSSYYLKSSAQLTTDNPALILTFAALAVVLFAEAGRGGAWRAFALGAAAVYVRHISAWLAAPLLVESVNVLRRRGPAAALPWALAAAGLAALLGYFVWAWGGLVPPLWASAQGDPSLTSAVYTLALAGIFGWFFLYASGESECRAGDWWAAGAGVLAGGVLFLFAETGPSQDDGRWGGVLWAVAERLPVIGGRSYLFLPLASAGGGLLAVFARRLFMSAPDKGLVWMTALGAWLVTGVVNRQIFQRYYESPLLGFLGFWLLLMWSVDGSSGPKRRVAPLYVLALLLMLWGTLSMVFSKTGFGAPLLNLFPAE